MSYPHGFIEVRMTPITTATADNRDELLVSGTGEKSRLFFGYQTHVLRAVAISSNITGTAAVNPVISLRLTTGGAGDSSATGDQFASITIASGDNRGTWYYVNNLNQRIGGVNELRLHVTTAATKAQPVRAIAYLVPEWDTPLNATGSHVLVTG